MFRHPVLLLLMLLLVLSLGGLLAIGAFPPAAAPVAVERVLSNDRFQPR